MMCEQAEGLVNFCRIYKIYEFILPSWLSSFTYFFSQFLQSSQHFGRDGSIGSDRYIECNYTALGIDLTNSMIERVQVKTRLLAASPTLADR